jgi:hypothetical protein
VEWMTSSTFDCDVGQVSQLVARVGETGNERLCLTEGQMERQRQLFAAVDARKFQMKCEANAAGGSCVGSDTLSVTVGQRVRMGGVEGMWDSVAVHCKEEDDGTLIVRIVVSNPDWDEPLQIACIRSRPHDPECLTALGCNLDHVTT